MKIKGFLLAGAAGAAVAPGMSSAPAIAADMGVPARAAPPPYVAPSWTGFYVGGTIGAAVEYATANFDGFGGPSTSHTGFTGGGELGYNWQSGNFVYGLEGDLSALSGTGSVNAPLGGGTYTDKISWLSTVRGRAGLAFGDTLAYVTAGLAIGHVHNTTNTFGFANYSDSSTRTGLAVGAGVEHMLDAHWSVKLEGLWADLGQRSVDSPTGTPGEPNTYTNRTVIGRVGLNYKF